MLIYCTQGLVYVCSGYTYMLLDTCRCIQMWMVHYWLWRLPLSPLPYWPIWLMHWPGSFFLLWPAYFLSYHPKVLPRGMYGPLLTTIAYSTTYVHEPWRKLCICCVIDQDRRLGKVKVHKKQRQSKLCSTNTHA